MTTETRTVYEEINEERSIQRRQWGTPDTEAENGLWFWLALLAKHMGKFSDLVLSDDPGYGHDLIWSAARHRLIVIAALCIAAIEAEDYERRTRTTGVKRQDGQA